MKSIQKNRESNSGASNSQAKIIKIFNNEDVTMFIAHGNFKELCDKNKLPYSALMNSYRNKGSRIYTGNNVYSVKKDNIKYKGWYATK